MGEKGQAATGVGATAAGALSGVGANTPQPQSLGSAIGAVGSNTPQPQGVGGSISSLMSQVGADAPAQGSGDISGLMSQVASADPTAAAAATAAANAQGSGEKGQATGNLSDLSSQQQAALQLEQDRMSKAGATLSNAAKQGADSAAAVAGNMK